jgi:hypothetical protein
MAATLTTEHLRTVDTKLSTVSADFNTLADDATVERTKASLQKLTHHVHVVANGADALTAVKSLIPKGAKVYSTASISLQQIGYVELAKTTGDFVSLNAAVVAETDPAKQHQLRREAALADIVVSSPVSITEEGDILIADLTNTRLGPIVMGGNVVFVVGANKIAKNLDAAMKRLYEYALPLESARVRIAYHMPNGASNASNVLIIRGGNPFGAARIHVVIVKESLGY